ncbi:hypothetical protein K445DRAFT_374760 [Daldinia sp. EC12]|nr:hypothetical protein F4774DRAFT_44483 [Daldinia eschscholtzii]OTB16787.1 hypothetical protein K445DRAFT_374760 [Daldinia sp. EC12]
MNNLNDLLEEHLSRRNRVFYAFGIGVGNCESSTSGAWTVVSLYIHGIVDRNGAIEALGSLEHDINSKLRLEQRPERLEFYLEDDSPSNAYRARSRRIAGTLSANDAVRQMGTVEPTDGERTRPGTPRPDTEEVTRQVINIEL